MARTWGKHLYLIQMARTGDLKVGRSNNPVERLAQLQTGCPQKLRLLLSVADSGERERDLHRRLKKYACRGGRGEWFSVEGIAELPTDIYEMLDLDDEDWWSRG